MRRTVLAVLAPGRNNTISLSLQASTGFRLYLYLRVCFVCICIHLYLYLDVAPPPPPRRRHEDIENWFSHLLLLITRRWLWDNKVWYVGDNMDYMIMDISMYGSCHPLLVITHRWLADTVWYQIWIWRRLTYGWLLDMDGNWFFIEPIMVFLPPPPISLETRPCQMIHGAASPKRMEEKARSSREKAIISSSPKSIVVECFVSIVSNNLAVLFSFCKIWLLPISGMKEKRVDVPAGEKELEVSLQNVPFLHFFP